MGPPEVGVRWSEAKRFVHPRGGAHRPVSPEPAGPRPVPVTLIFTATPGTTDYEKLALLTVLRTDSFPIG